ncbi:hypothetical protein [Lysobacter sp. P5_B9]
MTFTSGAVQAGSRRTPFNQTSPLPSITPLALVPIPGTRRRARLDENAGAARIELGTAELQRIDAVLATHAVAGTRYPAAHMSAVNV